MIGRRACALAVAVVLLTTVAGAQRPTVVRDPVRATVRGVVRDTLARRPLAGALVQLAGDDSTSSFTRSARSDSLGRYAIDSVPVGRYAIGFLHAQLDSLGLQVPARTIRVRNRRDVRTNLSTPSANELSVAFCGAARAVGGLVLGVVRDARNGRPIAGATVTGEWVEFTLTRGDLQRRQPVQADTTSEIGTYALCGVPSAGSVYVRAIVGSDSTDQLDLHAPSSGVLRRDLFVGASTGMLSGVAMTADSTRPLAGALVRVAGGTPVRANARGEWRLLDAPAGTRTLEVRAIGYYPARIPVDVVTGAAPVRAELSTFQAMLDTVRVIASRVADRSEGGFERRMRSTPGHFITEADIAKRPNLWASDILRMAPGARLEGSGIDRWISVRGMFGGRCVPSVYVDGMYMFTLSADELDAIVTPSRIRGIEIHVGTVTPIEFQQSIDSCGAIVIWTKGAPAGRR